MRAVAHLADDSRVERVTFQNVPSFVYARDLEIRLPPFGRIVIGVAFGGAFYAILPADRVGLQVAPEQTTQLVAASVTIGFCRMRLFRLLSLVLFLAYLAVFPGSTIVVALDRVPAWGEWMGGGLLVLQGAAALCWLLGFHGRRGAIAGALVFLLAWAVEHVGVTSGFPFGRYRYTEMLQPQLLGVVPAPIAFAWVMVAVGAWQLATNDQRRRTKDQDTQQALVVCPWSLVKVATLVLLLDLQIETVATAINRYWVWLDSGPYYGVPTANFAAWWLVGLGMAGLVAQILTASDGRRAGTRFDSRFTLHASRIPAYLYMLSTLMFTVVNLARGYPLAGLIGAGVLLAVALRAFWPPNKVLFEPRRAQTRRGE